MACNWEALCEGAFSHTVVEARQLVAAPGQDVDALLQKLLGLPSPIFSRKWRLLSLFLLVGPTLRMERA